MTWSKSGGIECTDEMLSVLKGFLKVLDIIADTKLSQKAKNNFMQARLDFGVKLSEKTIKEKQEVRSLIHSY